MKDFKNLKIWEKAHEITLMIYEATRNFPKDELYGITGQIRRASVSISANIAEGCGRSGDKELSRFLQISMGSACELEYLLYLSRELKFLNSLSYEKIENKLITLKKMLSTFIKKLTAERRTLIADS